MGGVTTKPTATEHMYSVAGQEEIRSGGKGKGREDGTEEGKFGGRSSGRGIIPEKQLLAGLTVFSHAMPCL